jgi:thiosulfate dehydrogenase
MKSRKIIGPLAPALFFSVQLLAVSALASPASTEDELVQRGAYLAQMGDCGACHTAEGGKPMAGGREFKTPAGTIYSTNITPDAKTGIGGYSFAQFERAVRKGVAADGHHLYPAMPYPSFSKISDKDVQALYSYVMKGVSPVEQANKESQMRWPFSMRWGMALWNLTFLDSRPFVADPTKDSSWNRGAYIVEGLGHCGTCHTPRGFGMQEKAMGEDGKNFLAGSTLPPWHAVSLRNLWAEPEIVQFLKTGSNSHAMAYGNMTEVIHYSTQHFSDDDLQAVAHFLKSMASGPSVPAPAPESITVAHEPTDGLYTTRGGLGYTQFCASCHRRDGEGAAGVFPPLARNASVLSGDPTSVIHIALTGWTSAATKHTDHAFSMPEYSSLSDEELADILSFVRTSWGNRSSPVEAAQVEAMRKELEPVSTAPARFLEPRFSGLLSNSNADQLIFGMRLITETKDLLPKNVGVVLNCSSCHLNGGTVANASPFVGLTATFPAYGARAGRVISIEERLNGCFKRSMNGAPLGKDSKEMRAMVAFMDWMKGNAKPDDKIEGRGIGKINSKLIPDPARGQNLYKSGCAVCHGENGEGRKQTGNVWIFPPLWGESSFNIGAGIARTFKAAAFIKSNMPVGHGQNFPQGQGGLSDQDAVDIAEFFTHQPRPDFPEKVNDWPKGGRPEDARY